MRQGEGCQSGQDFQVWFTRADDPAFCLFAAFDVPQHARRVARSLVESGCATYAEVRQIQDWFRLDKAGV